MAVSGASPERILLAGPPSCGKTTVVRRVVEQLRHRRLAGFYTQEIRSPLRVGRYGVDLAGFEAIVLGELDRSENEVDVFVVDEIGKMECFSKVFVETVERLLNSPVHTLATVAMKGSGLIARVKARPDVEVLPVSPENRDNLPNVIATRLPLR